MPDRTKDGSSRVNGGEGNRVTEHLKVAELIKLFKLILVPEVPCIRGEGLEGATGETGKSQFFRSDGLRLKSMNMGGVDGSHGVKEKLDSTGDCRG